MILYVDIDTGEVRRSLTGPVITGLVMYLRDILSLGIVYVQDGAAVTTTVLAGSAVQKIGLRAKPSDADLLALASTYSLAGDIATATFSLNTSELVDWFTDNLSTDVRESAFFLELEVSAADESTRQTYWQGTVMIRRDVNQPGDITPPDVDTALYVLKGALFDGNGRAISPFYVAHRGEVTGRTGGGSANLDGITTTTLTIPFAALIVIAGSGEIWQLVSGTDAEDGTFIVRPDDYHGTTNPRVWKRVL
jgi:hypothetical protein